MGSFLSKLNFFNKESSFITPIVKKYFKSAEKKENSQEVSLYPNIIQGVNKETFELDIMGDEKPKILSVRTTPKEKRVPLDKLESAYRRDAHLFNGVNLYTKMIMGAGYTLRCDSPKIKTFIDIWDTEVGLKDIFDEIVTHMLVYGNAYVELVYGSKGNIVGLLPMDPKRIDYLKSINGDILVDPNTGSPYGYIQKIPFGMTKKKESVKIPKGVSIGDDEIYLPTENVVHFKLYTVGEGYYGIGLIEPVYNLSIIKFNVEEGFGEAAHRTGMPLITAQIGDEQHEPTPKMVNDVVDQILQMKANSVGGYPYYVGLSILESQRGLESLSDALDYFVGAQAASLSVPLPLLTGSGAKTNRSVLLIQYQLLERSMALIQGRIGEGFKKVFNLMANLNHWDLTKTPIKIDWNEISITDMNEKARRLGIYAKNGIVTPDDKIEAEIRNIEDLPSKDTSEETTGKTKPKLKPNENKISKESKPNVPDNKQPPSG